MASRLRYLVTVYGPGCLPGHRDYLKRHDSLGFDAGRLLCPLVPREPSERLARPPSAVSGCPPRPQSGAWRIRFDPPPPPVDRAAWRIRAHAGASARRNSAILAYRVTAHWHLGVGIHKLWRRACTGFPPAVWSPSLSGWLPTTPPQGGSHMAATIAPAPKRHQRKFVSTLAATALQADLAHRHYRIAPPGDRPPEAPSAASGRRPVVTVRCASDLAPDEHRHRAHHRLAGADHRDAGPTGVRRPPAAPPALEGHRPHPRRAAGPVRPHRHDAAAVRRLVGLGVREVARRRERVSGRSGPLFAPCADEFRYGLLRYAEPAGLAVRGDGAPASSRPAARSGDLLPQSCPAPPRGGDALARVSKSTVPQAGSDVRPERYTDRLRQYVAPVCRSYQLRPRELRPSHAIPILSQAELRRQDRGAGDDQQADGGTAALGG